MPEADKGKRIKPVIEEVKPEDQSTASNTIAATENPQPETQIPVPKESSKEEKPVTQTPPEPPTKKRSRMKITILVILITTVLVALLAGGVYVYMNGISRLPEETPESTPTVVPTPTPEASPEASPGAEVDLTSYKLSILNGSGKIGEAGRVEKLLENAGFEVTNTANAKTFDYLETLVEVKEDVPQSVVDLIKETLSGSYKIEIGDTLEVDSTYDIVVTVGSE